MALPTDSNDTFLKEVDENLRRDQFQDFFKKYGTWIAARRRPVPRCGRRLDLLAGASARSKLPSSRSSCTPLFTDIASGQAGRPCRSGSTSSSKSHSDVVRASAMLDRCGVALDKNDRSAAIAKYRELADDKGLPQAYRDVGTIRLTALEFDTHQAARRSSLG